MNLPSLTQVHEYFAEGDKLYALAERLKKPYKWAADQVEDLRLETLAETKAKGGQES